MSGFISNPNQKEIVINKLICDDKGNNYTRFRLDALQKAMKTLTPKAFQLWCYLAKNKDGYTLYLSKVDFLNWSIVSESSYHKAVQELKDKMYLIPKQNSSTTKYNFYQLPYEDKENVLQIEIHSSCNKQGFCF